MLKGKKQHIDKEQGKTKHEAPRSVNYRATQNNNNIGTTLKPCKWFDGSLSFKFVLQICNGAIPLQT